MSVLLAILGIIKIILIILLCLLAFLLLTTVYIIVTPFYYKVFVSHHSKTDYKFRIATFLHTLVVTGDSSREMPITIRIFWFFRKKLTMDSTIKSDTAEAVSELPREMADGLKGKAAKEAEKAEEEKPSKKEKRRLKREKRDDRKGEIKSAWQTFKGFKNYPHKKAIFRATLKLLKEILNAIKPKDLKIKCLFGLSNPFDTGIILAAISIVKPFVNVGEIQINADFENETFEIDINAKGWFNLLSILMPLIRFIRTKPVWQLIKIILFKKRRDDNNGQHPRRKS